MERKPLLDGQTASNDNLRVSRNGSDEVIDVFDSLSPSSSLPPYLSQPVSRPKSAAVIVQ
jgi:hypothetical protein